MTTLNPKLSKIKIDTARIGNGQQAHDNAEKPTGQEGEDHYKAFRFSFADVLIRAAARNDEPIFMNDDLCPALGLAPFKNSFAHHLRTLQPHQKFEVSRSVFGAGNSTMKIENETARSANDGMETASGKESGAKRKKPLTWAVTESGLYTLIMRNREATTPGTAANRFLHWVTEEVLPAIRKTGSFANASQPDGQDTITIDLREEARWVVINFPGKKPIIRRTPVDGLLDEWSALDTQILAAQIQTVHALWQKAEMIRSFGDDPAGSPMYDHLGTSISDAARLAREYRLAIITRPE